MKSHLFDILIFQGAANIEIYFFQSSVKINLFVFRNKLSHQYFLSIIAGLQQSVARPGWMEKDRKVFGNRRFKKFESRQTAEKRWEAEKSHWAGGRTRPYSMIKSPTST